MDEHYRYKVEYIRKIKDKIIYIYIKNVEDIGNFPKIIRNSLA